MLVALTAICCATFALCFVHLLRQETTVSKLDDILAAINAETNELAAKIDALEVAAGGTVTQANLDALASISARLKGLAADPAPAAAPAAVPVVVEAAPVVTAPPAPETSRS